MPDSADTRQVLRFNNITKSELSNIVGKTNGLSRRMAGFTLRQIQFPTPFLLNYLTLRYLQ